MIKLRCSSCQQKLNVSPKLAGQQAACPKCGEKLNVPAESTSDPKHRPPVNRAAENAGSQSADDKQDDPDHEDHEPFPDISEFLVADEYNQQLPAVTRRKPSQNPAATKPMRQHEMQCLGCGKTMPKSDRYCIACGYNHFDAVETAVATQQQIRERLDREYGGMRLLQWLRIFFRFFR